MDVTRQMTQRSEEEPHTGRARAVRAVKVEPSVIGPDAAGLPGDAFWTAKTVKQLASEQGVAVPQLVDELVGQGADLWESDEEFEQFVTGIRERRRGSKGDEGMHR